MKTLDELLAIMSKSDSESTTREIHVDKTSIFLKEVDRNARPRPSGALSYITLGFFFWSN